jgi:hypothetical protein
VIDFSHSARQVRLSAGETFASEPRACYRDAPEEDLRSLTAQVEAGIPWREAVRQRYSRSRPWLSRIVTDPSRDLFFRLHPPPPASRVLDIGAGWGQTALPLARANDVTALEPTPERLSFLRAAAAQEGLAGRIHFVGADFFEVDFATRFDLVACIGVLEWTPKFRLGDPRDVQVDFLRRAGAILAPKGSLVVGIENRLGLKYQLGARDDHIGVPGIANLEYPEADRKWRALTGEPLRSVTHSRAGLAAMFSEAGLKVTACYAAFPDYKLPQAILRAGSEVDRFLSGGNFVPEHDGIDGDLLPFQEELKSGYRVLAARGAATEAAPSFFMVAEAAGH